ncbi:YadA domain-containing protein [Caballeronia humi]|uniref:YadA domain-containing protein n=2 Tax=Caballeronia humi TaxID=326474 RepID=A0A158I7K4_9BURK|nr:YadA domain-containing protein [Caballeronia humi]
MNKLYRAVWNSTTGTYVAAPETAKASGKKASTCIIKVMLGSVFLIGSGTAFANGLFNDNSDASCTSVNAWNANDVLKYDNVSCGISLGSTGGTANWANASIDNFIANSKGAFVYGGLEVFGTGVAAGSPAAYIHGGLSLFSNGTTSGTTNKLIGLAAGTAPTDAVNLSQLNGAEKYFHVNSIGANSSATGTDSIGIGPNAKASNNYAVAMGSNTAATGVQATALGSNASAGGSFSTAVGNYASAAGDAATVVGYSATASGEHAIALGGWSTAAGAESVALGRSASAAAGATKGVALGQSANVTAANSVALGADSTTSANLTAAGYKPGATAVSGVASAANGEVSVGSSGNERRVTNIAAGAAATDAVNVSQLQSEAANVDALGTSTASALGGGAAYNSGTGAIAKPTYTIGGKTYNDVGTALVAAEGASADAVKYDSAAHDSVTLGNAGTPVQVTNVKAGALDATSKDAVNGSQLFATNEQVAANTGDITSINSTVSTIDGRVTQNTTDISTISGSLADAVKYDSAAHDSVTLGNAGTPVQVTNVKAGALDATSKDAVNGSQLFATNEQVAANTGDITTINSTVSAIDGRVTQNTTDISTINTTISTINGSLADAVQYDSAAHDSITLGNAGTPVQVTNVKAGALNATSKDAVNGSQLFATNEQLATNTDDIADITNNLNNGSLGLVQQDQATRNISVARDTDGNRVDFTGTTGTRELLGVSAGTTMSSAINLSQLQPVVAGLGGGATVNPDGSVTGPTYSVQGNTQTDVGSALNALDSGLTSLSDKVNGTDLGLVAQDGTTRDITIGAKTDGAALNVAGTAGNRKVTGVANGHIAAASVDAINGSQLAAVSTSVVNAIGGGSVLNSDGSISLPTFNVGGTTTHNIGDALTSIDGRVTQSMTEITNLKTTVNNQGTGAGSPNAVSYDTEAHAKVTFGKDGTPTSLTNVADGTLSAASTDAVNGRQLFATNTKVEELGEAIRNVSTTGSTATGFGPSVGGEAPVAIATGGGSIAIGDGANSSGDNAVSIGSGSAASAENSVALGAHSVADQPNTVSIGSDGNERRLTNVAPGINGTDAVNMNQLQSGMGEVARNGYSGVAAATALSMIPEVDADKTLSVGFGYGSYKGYSAGAFGGTARVTKNLKLRAGAGWGSGGKTVGTGGSYQW